MNLKRRDRGPVSVASLNQQDRYLEPILHLGRLARHPRRERGGNLASVQRNITSENVTRLYQLHQ
jgi:hypothetical protein